MLSIKLFEEQHITFDIPPSDKPQTIKVIFKKHQAARQAQLIIDAPDRIRIIRPISTSPSKPSKPNIES